MFLSCQIIYFPFLFADVLPVQIGAEVTLTCNFEKIDEFKDWFLVQNGNTYPLSTGSGRKNMKVSEY